MRRQCPVSVDVAQRCASELRCVRLTEMSWCWAVGMIVAWVARSGCRATRDEHGGDGDDAGVGGGLGEFVFCGRGVQAWVPGPEESGALLPAAVGFPGGLG